MFQVGWFFLAVVLFVAVGVALPWITAIAVVFGKKVMQFAVVMLAFVCAFWLVGHIL